MPDMISDALRLAIKALQDAAESRRMPSGVDLDQATADLHADAAKTLEEALANRIKRLTPDKSPKPTGLPPRHVYGYDPDPGF